MTTNSQDQVIDAPPKQAHRQQATGHQGGDPRYTAMGLLVHQQPTARVIPHENETQDAFEARARAAGYLYIDMVAK